ncbi:MAG: DUF6293 family protein [Candidatus Aenigmatarchaeota archaeon]
MKSIVVAPVGDQLESLFGGLKEFPTEKIILISPEEKMEDANNAKRDLERFKIPVDIIKIKGNIWEEMFKTISDIKKAQPDKNIIINVSTGDRTTRCAATSAAFVNGMKAFAVDGDNTMLLPVLKFNYYRLLTEKKMRILTAIYEQKDCCSSLEQLGKKTNMSLPLISYHINGSSKSDGLKSLGLIETEEKRGKISVTLSVLGRLLIRGYVDSPEA